MIRIEYKPEYLAYVVIRTREGYPRGQYLTNNGWKNKEATTTIEIDETMLWESEEELMEMATELARLGIKPKEASYIEGELKATKVHLEDMRTLVLKKK